MSIYSVKKIFYFCIYLIILFNNFSWDVNKKNKWINI